MTIYLGENIKRLRKENEITQEKLAEFLGVTFQSVSNWERGESYPDITMLPEIAAFFKVSVDELLGLNKAKAQIKIDEYLEYYDKNRFIDTSLTFNKFKIAIKEFPQDYRIVVRYMELLMCDTSPDSSDYEKVSRELFSLYENIQQNCTDDSIRMWSKRLICQHLHTKSHYSNNEEYQKECEKIMEEMPDLINTKDYLSTMLITDKEKHYNACSTSIENLIFLLEHSVDHYCLYDEKFTPEYKIRALEKMLTVYNLFYTSGNFGKSWADVIYNHGHLGHLYAQCNDNIKALNNLKKCAAYAREYDLLPENKEYNTQFFENRTFTKKLRGKTMCQRMYYLMTEKYPLPEEFKKCSEFQEILSSLE